MDHPLNKTVQAAVPYATGDSLAGGSPQTAAIGRGVVARMARSALQRAAALWFAIAVLGQLMLVVYVIGFYGRTAVRGDFAAWGKVLSHGFVPGDTFGNLVLSAHLAFATLITVGGALQLVPAVRRLAPAFHRWNGRTYLLSCLVMSLAGLIMLNTRGGPGDLSQHIGLSINALLILLCAGMALRHAVARRIAVHRRWGLRLFLVVSGSWFFRIGLMLWIVVNQGPVGFDPKTFTGPFLSFLIFAEYVIPLAVLELYFRAQASSSPRAHLAMATGLVALTLMTAAGSIAASMLLWLPRL